jgi:hypothetical protein
MERNIILLSLLTLVFYFVVGNPYTYAIMSKITTLKVKDKKQHMILVGIHAAVMTLLMYVAYIYLIKDKVCPKPRVCPPPKKCPTCDDLSKDSKQEPVQKKTPTEQPSAPTEKASTQQPDSMDNSGLSMVEGFSF